MVVNDGSNSQEAVPSLKFREQQRQGRKIKPHKLPLRTFWSFQRRRLPQPISSSDAIADCGRQQAPLQSISNRRLGSLSQETSRGENCLSTSLPPRLRSLHEVDPAVAAAIDQEV